MPKAIVASEVRTYRTVRAVSAIEGMSDLLSAVTDGYCISVPKATVARAVSR